MPVKMDGGADPARFFRELPLASLPTQGDMLYALSRQSTRILKRTERGVDFQGRPFDQYSERGPYYYYASKSGGRKNGGELKRRKQAGQRLARALGHKGGVTRSGGIRFESYGAFKRALGRGNVDLQGPRAPHMLQEMVVKSGTAGAQIREPGLTQYPGQAKEGRIGIYGAAGARAEGHNEGTGRLPKRRFLDASERDIQEMMDDIGDRADMRIRRI